MEDREKRDEEGCSGGGFRVFGREGYGRDGTGSGSKYTVGEEREIGWQKRERNRESIDRDQREERDRRRKRDRRVRWEEEDEMRARVLY